MTMKGSRIRSGAVVVVLMLGMAVARGAAAQSNSWPGPIEVAQAIMTPRHGKVLDFKKELQDLCGTGAHSCEVFCAKQVFWPAATGKVSLCRVTYRCGAEQVRSLAATEGDPLVLSCRPTP